MKRLLLAAGLLACASAPGPKVPDESHRVPVNRTVPPEVVRPSESQMPATHDPGRADRVEWR
jgi:hypothetical protein